MADIRHELTVEAPPERLFEALATAEGVAHWWERDVRGDGGPGGRLAVGFRDGTSVALDVAVHRPQEQLVWSCAESSGEWRGTCIRFDLEPSGDGTVLRFGHEGWREPSDFFARCSYHWALILRALKRYAETGRGREAP